MGVHRPATQPTAVGVAGTIVTVPIPKGLRNGGAHPFNRVVVVPTSGDATSMTVELTSDADATTRSERIAYWTGVTTAAPVDDTGPFPWFNIDGNVYVKLVPNAGSNNAYTIYLFTDEE